MGCNLCRILLMGLDLLGINRPRGSLFPSSRQANGYDNVAIAANSDGKSDYYSFYVTKGTSICGYLVLP
jgi:hypothetical protein